MNSHEANYLLAKASVVLREWQWHQQTETSVLDRVNDDLSKLCYEIHSYLTRSNNV